MKIISLIVVVLTIKASPLCAEQLVIKGKVGLASAYGLSLYKDNKNYYLILHIKDDTRTISDHIVLPDPPEGYRVSEYNLNQDIDTEQSGQMEGTQID